MITLDIRYRRPIREFQVIDVAPGECGGSHYASTNECVQVNTAFAKVPARKKLAVAICSGGEVPLLCLLPIYDRVIAIDNSWGSMIHAIVKATYLMRTHPCEATRTIRAITNGEYYNLAQKMAPWIPAVAQPHLTKIQHPYDINDKHCMIEYWKPVLSVDLIRTIRDRLDNLTFIHGDLEFDLPSYCHDADLIYTSNALDYSRCMRDTRQYRAPDVEEIARKCLRPGGHIISMRAPFGEKESSNFKPIASVPSTGWTHYLWQYTPKENVANE